MDTRRQHKSEQSKRRRNLRLTNRSTKPYPWPPKQAQPDVSKPGRSTKTLSDHHKTYLEQELKPKADGDFALGSDLFAKRLAYNEMVDIPPDRLLDIAYAQLRKDHVALWENLEDGRC